MKLPSNFKILPEVYAAIENGVPVVALESAVITHGLPRPENLNLARSMEAEIRAQGAVPATTAVLDGKVHIGLTDEDLVRLSEAQKTRKISRRDYGIALAAGEFGGTTVAGTLIAASRAGIKVFATGGIGGVHRGNALDVSADLPELSRTPMVVVCAGAKAILDLPATMEYLETNGVPVVGYQTSELPAFYTRSSGLSVNFRAETPAEIARIASSQWEMGLQSAVLVGNPPPSEIAIPSDVLESTIQNAVRDAEQQGIHGAAVTPFLLDAMYKLTGGESLKTNIALLLNNARLAAGIAKALSVSKKDRPI